MSDVCPKCGGYEIVSSWKDGRPVALLCVDCGAKRPLDVTQRAAACPKCGDTSHIIGVEVPGEYDGILYWRCERCDLPFHRWPEGSFWRLRAERFVPALASHPSPDATP